MKIVGKSSKRSGSVWQWRALIYVSDQWQMFVGSLSLSLSRKIRVWGINGSVCMFLGLVSVFGFVERVQMCCYFTFILVS